jgi:hypothetical protein
MITSPGGSHIHIIARPLEKMRMQAIWYIQLYLIIPVSLGLSLNQPCADDIKNEINSANSLSLSDATWMHCMDPFYGDA